jgi:hypothetical protein
MNKITRQARKHARQRQKRGRTITFFIIVIGVLGLAGYLLASAFSRPVLEPADNVIDIAADMAGFDRQEIRVKVGEPVTLRLTSLDNQFHTDGGGKHQWAVDEKVVAACRKKKFWTQIHTDKK